MKVDAHELWMAVKNATLYCKPKTWNGGEARFWVAGSTMTVTASDDFVTVVTEVAVEGAKGDDEFFVPTKRLKELEVVLREAEGPFELDWAPEAATEPEWWESLEDFFARVGPNLAAITTWELNPERLTLLSRLEPKGRYPLSWKAFRVDDRNLWGFKYGPRTNGFVVPLERGALESELEDAEEALWQQ